MRKVVAVFSIMLVILASGCIKHEQSVQAPRCDPVKLPAGSLGSRENPVRCDMPRGQVAYLQKLIGPDGQPVRFVRSGNLGRGVNGNIVDRYIVQASDGSLCVEVIMDMYFHGYVETKPIEGFKIGTGI